MDTRHYYYYYRSDKTLILLLLLLLLLLLSDNCYLCWTMIELVSCGWFEIVLRGQKGQKRSIHVCACERRQMDGVVDVRYTNVHIRTMAGA